MKDYTGGEEPRRGFGQRLKVVLLAKDGVGVCVPVEEKFAIWAPSVRFTKARKISVNIDLSAAPCLLCE